MYHEAHCKFKNVFFNADHSSAKKPPTFTGRRFFVECTSNIKSVPTIQSFGKKCKGKHCLVWMSCNKPLVFTNKRNNH